MSEYSLFQKLLDYYQISLEDYQRLIRPLTYEDIPSPFLFKDMDKAVELVNKHVSLKHKIIVYGDYDADGITGCSILVKAFLYRNYRINYYIPSRYLDGYGINTQKAQEIIDKGYDLVITVDNGISAFEPIKMLKEAGIDVLVIDHHEPQETLPEANVIIHPNVSEYTKSITSSGAFTAFMFSWAMLGYPDKYLATLASISLISDMMPLKEFNRDLLRLTMEGYTHNEFPSIEYLLAGEPFNDTTIGLSIAPKINAIGRVDKTTNINRLIKYFTIDDKDEIIPYKNWMISLNEIRKEKTKQSKEEIIDNLEGYQGKALVIKVDLEEGLLGLVANSLMNQLKIPVIVLTIDSNNPSLLKGSARSIDGFNLANSFIALSSYLEAFGGHALAAGLTLKSENFEAFKKAFNELVEKTELTPTLEKYIDIGINDLNEDNYLLIQSFSPFGEEWKKPLLKLRHIKVSELMYSNNRMNIITTIGRNTRLVGFGMSQEKMNQYHYIDLYGNLRISEFMGRRYIEFLINKIEESK